METEQIPPQAAEILEEKAESIKEDECHGESNSRSDSSDAKEKSGLNDHSSSRRSSHSANNGDLERGRDQHHEQGDEIYTRFSPRRKISIVAILCMCSFMAPISSTSILAASPQVVATFHTTGAVFDASNALFIAGLAICPLIYGPIGQTCGRKWTLSTSAILFTAFSIGTALAPNLPACFVFRILTALNGTSFFIIGGAVIGDIYRPVDRGTAYGWFLSGTLIGPALGPVLGGIIVTYASWRNIFWLQTAIAAVSSTCAVCFLPETSHHPPGEYLRGLPRRQQARLLWAKSNPTRLLFLFRYPNLLVAALATSALVWNMYSLLTPIQYVLNPRFGLTTPLQGGLFYLAPGAGYLLGTFFGGRRADAVVRAWIRKRGGQRVPEDRLRSCLLAMGVVIPGSMLIYGWTVDMRVGGVPVPVLAMFAQGAAQTFAFASVNTYCIDVMQQRSAEVVAGNYVMRYAFAAAGTAVCLPVIDRIGVGWFSTISAGFLIVATLGLWATTQWGMQWREWVDGKASDESR